VNCEVIFINSGELNEIQSIISELKKSGKDVDTLKQEISQRGLDPQVKNFEAKYGKQINAFIDEVNKKDMNAQEKAQLVMNMKKKLSPDQQKQFDSLLSALKGYLKSK
jgi:hypothetical protein